MIPPARTFYRPSDFFSATAAARRSHSDTLYLDSGTAAMTAAFSFLRDRRGVRSIALSPFTCGAVRIALEAADLRPLFYDFSEGTFAPDAGAVSSLLAEDSGRAVLYTHLLGFHCGFGEIVALCREKSAILVEDRAHLPIGYDEDEPLPGAFAIYSFGVSKPLSIGTGGGLRIAGHLREEVDEYLSSWRTRSTSALRATAALSLAFLKTRPRLLGLLAPYSPPDAERGSPVESPRGEQLLTRLHRRQINLVENLSAGFERHRRLRAEVVDFYREFFDRRGDVTYPFAASEMSEALPLRFPVILRGGGREQVQRNLRRSGLWVNSWIQELLCEDPAAAPHAAGLLAGILMLPVSFRLGRDMEREALRAKLEKAFQVP